MLWNWTRRILAGVLTAGVLWAPALAAEPETPAQTPSPWTYDALADSYAMGLVDDDYPSYIQNPLTQEQLEACLLYTSSFYITAGDSGTI